MAMHQNAGVSGEALRAHILQHQETIRSLRAEAEAIYTNRQRIVENLTTSQKAQHLAADQRASDLEAMLRQMHDILADMSLSKKGSGYPSGPPGPPPGLPGSSQDYDHTPEHPHGHRCSTGSRGSRTVVRVSRRPAPDDYDSPSDGDDEDPDDDEPPEDLPEEG